MSAPGPAVRLERKRDWHAQVAPCFRLSGLSEPIYSQGRRASPARADDPSTAIPDFADPWSHRATLDVHGHAYADGELQQLFDDALWMQLRTLNLGDNRLTYAGMASLALHFPPRLSTLLLFGNRLDRRGAHMLAEAPWHSLRRLDLRDCDLGDQGLEALVRRAPTQLQELRLAGNRLGHRSCYLLAQGPFRALQLLDLARNGLNPAGFAALLQAPWPHLVSLDLTATSANKQAVRELVLAILPALRRLDLSQIPMGAVETQMLSARFGSKLHALALRGCGLDAAATGSLLLAAWPALMGLDLDGNPLAASGLLVIKQARKAERLPHLIRLVVPQHPAAKWANHKTLRWLWPLLLDLPYQRQQEALRQAMLASLQPSFVATRMPSRPEFAHRSSSQRTVRLDPVARTLE